MTIVDYFLLNGQVFPLNDNRRLNGHLTKNALSLKLQS